MEGERRERNKSKRQPGRTGPGQRREWQLKEINIDRNKYIIDRYRYIDMDRNKYVNNIHRA